MDAVFTIQNAAASRQNAANTEMNGGALPRRRYELGFQPASSIADELHGFG